MYKKLTQIIILLEEEKKLSSYSSAKVHLTYFETKS